MALIEDPRVSKVSFTRLHEVGTTVMQAAAPERHAGVAGARGEVANVVFDDADLDVAVAKSLWSVFDNAGQDCCARSRQFVQRGVYDRYVARFAEATAAVRVAAPLSEEHRDGAADQPRSAADLGSTTWRSGRRRAPVS